MKQFRLLIFLGIKNTQSKRLECFFCAEGIFPYLGSGQDSLFVLACAQLVSIIFIINLKIYFFYEKVGFINCYVCFMQYGVNG